MVLNDSGVIGYSLNGKSFPATAPIVAGTGDWILLHYFNEGTQIHPMHLHQFDQIVLARDGFPLDAPYVADVVNVAPGERYSVLVQLDNPGAWVWHCHILPHVEATRDVRHGHRRRRCVGGTEGGGPWGRTDRRAGEMVSP